MQEAFHTRPHVTAMLEGDGFSLKCGGHSFLQLK
jgi:hypothetical protein